MANDPSTIKRRLVTGTGWAIGGRTATIILSLLANAVMARILAPSELGSYFLIFSFVSVMSVVAQLGLGKATVSIVAGELARNHDVRAGQIARTSLIVGLIASIVAAALLYFWFGSLIDSFVRIPGITEVTGYAMLWVVALTMTTLTAEIYRSHHDIRSATLFSGLFSGVVFVTGLGIVANSGDVVLVLVDVIGLAVVGALLSAVVGVVGLVLGQKLIRGWRWEHLILLLRTSSPILVTNLGLLILSQLDLWVLAYYRPQEDVALYGAAARLIFLVLTPLVIVHAVVPPLIAEMYAQHKIQKLEKVLRTTSLFSGLPGAIAVAVLLVFGEEVMGLVYGGHYSDGAMLLSILAMGNLMVLWSGTASIALMMTGHQMLMMAITMVTAGLTILLAMYLVGQHGAIGVAIATAMGTTLQHLSILIATRMKVGIWTHADYSKIHYIREVMRMLVSRIK